MSILQRHLLSATVGALSLVAGAAFAQPGPGPSMGPGGAPPAKPKIACAADMHRLCANDPPGRGAVQRCVKAHMSQVSPQCAQAVQYAREMRKERKAASAQQGGPAPGDMPPPSGGMQPPR